MKYILGIFLVLLFGGAGCSNQSDKDTRIDQLEKQVQELSVKTTSTVEIVTTTEKTTSTVQVKQPVKEFVQPVVKKMPVFKEPTEITGETQPVENGPLQPATPIQKEDAQLSIERCKVQTKEKQVEFLTQAGKMIVEQMYPKIKEIEKEISEKSELRKLIYNERFGTDINSYYIPPNADYLEDQLSNLMTEIEILNLEKENIQSNIANIYSQSEYLSQILYNEEYAKCINNL